MATYVELKGYKHGEIGNGRKKKDHNGLSTLDEIAKELNMSTTNLKRALRIERNLTDSMKELLDTGEIIKHSYLNQTTDTQNCVLVVFLCKISIITIKYKQIFWTYIRNSIDKYNHVFYTYHQGNTKLNIKDLSNHTNGAGTPLMDRSLYITTQNCA